MVSESEISSTIYCEVEIAESGVYERVRNSRVISVPHERIQQLVLCRRITAERPILQAMFAALLIVPSIYVLPTAPTYLCNCNVYALFRVVIPTALLAAFGIYLISGCIHKRVVLLVKMDGDSRKLVFKGDSSVDDLIMFVRESAKRYGYVASIDIG